MFCLIPQKKHETTNVLVKGLWWSGSGAVVDWLSEQNDAKLFGIFNTFLVEGGIGDILSSNESDEKAKMTRRLTKKTTKTYIKLKANQIRSEAISIFSNRYRKPHNRFSFVFQTIRHLYAFEKLVKQNDAVDELEFFKKYIHALKPKGSHKCLIFDQVIDIGYHNKLWQELFSPFKLIIVHRNPWDQLAQLVRQNKFGRSSNHIRTKPMKNELLTTFFSRVINQQYDNVLYMSKIINKEKLAIISFDEFVKNHSYYQQRLCMFLEIANNKSKQYRKKFNPDVSVLNIGIAEKENIKALQGYSEENMKNIDKKRALLFNLPHSI